MRETDSKRGETVIYITGDTHGQHDFVKLLYFADAYPELKKKGCLIDAGDFGGSEWHCLPLSPLIGEMSQSDRGAC